MADNERGESGNERKENFKVGNYIQYEVSVQLC